MSACSNIIFSLIYRDIISISCGQWKNIVIWILAHIAHPYLTVPHDLPEIQTEQVLGSGSVTCVLLMYCSSSNGTTADPTLRHALYEAPPTACRILALGQTSFRSGSNRWCWQSVCVCVCVWVWVCMRMSALSLGLDIIRRASFTECTSERFIEAFRSRPILRNGIDHSPSNYLRLCIYMFQPVPRIFMTCWV